MGKRRTYVTLLGSLVLSIGVTGQPADRQELQALRAQVQQLEAQLKALSQQLERAERAASRTETGPQRVATKPMPATDAAHPSLSVRGPGEGTADDATTIRLRALLQVDARTFSPTILGRGATRCSCGGRG